MQPSVFAKYCFSLSLVFLLGCDSSVTIESGDEPDVSVPDSSEVTRDGLFVRKYVSVLGGRDLFYDTFVNVDGILTAKHWGPFVFVSGSMPRSLQDSVLSLIGDIEYLPTIYEGCRWSVFYSIELTSYTNGEIFERLFQPCHIDYSLPENQRRQRGLDLIDTLAAKVIENHASWIGVTQEVDLVTSSVSRSDSLEFVLSLFNSTDQIREMLFVKESMVRLTSESLGYEAVDWGAEPCWIFWVDCEERGISISPLSTVTLSEKVPISIFLDSGSDLDRPLEITYSPNGIDYSGPIKSATISITQQ
jgi:hypothetical protein